MAHNVNTIELYVYLETAKMVNFVYFTQKTSLRGPNLYRVRQDEQALESKV